MEPPIRSSLTIIVLFVQAKWVKLKTNAINGANRELYNIIYYHQGKANGVANALNRKITGSLAHVDNATRINGWIKDVRS